MPAAVVRFFVTLAACLFLFVYILHVYLTENPSQLNALQSNCAAQAPVVLTTSEVPELNTFLQTIRKVQNNQQHVTAVLDRFETGQKAVLLLEDAGEEWVLPKHIFASQPETHTWFDVFVGNTGEIWLYVNCRKTAQESDKSDQLISQLKTKRYCPGNIDKNFSTEIQ
ncbi:hypothetical protein JNUCC1_02801 [Lentibacillus sp. JNUCC-1]|uniref:hypothetical protein n=1 Tax=Lentibacillus sp. JNUCC-1 TaxID=2654513 RepID=UPI0012E74419|nr:hypothetical protein [Lentibacillus sp. JNUCC-1]MUV38929.1 hypothetical protein [Lentibacillus sp. JNUCC-1]